MAKLSAHGAELFRVEHADCRVAYMADGNILRDGGGGWKLWRKFKPGVNIAEAVEQKRQFFANITPDRACRAAFRERMVSDFPCLETRVKVYTCVSLMPDDADGVWSELEAFGQGMDLDSVIYLCRLYKAAHDEGEAERKQRQPLPSPTH